MLQISPVVDAADSGTTNKPCGLTSLTEQSGGRGKILDRTVMGGGCERGAFTITPSQNNGALSEAAKQSEYNTHRRRPLLKGSEQQPAYIRVAHGNEDRLFIPLQDSL